MPVQPARTRQERPLRRLAVPPEFQRQPNLCSPRCIRRRIVARGERRGTMRRLRKNEATQKHSRDSAWCNGEAGTSGVTCQSARQQIEQIGKRKERAEGETGDGERSEDFPD